MKKGLLFGIFMIVSVVLLAQENASAYDAGSAVAQHETHVTPAQALNVGYTFMRTGAGANTGTRGGTHGNEVPSQAMQLVYTGQAYDSLTGTVTDCYYVFALQPKGFVIVAADDRVEPILGYSYDNDFVVANMPDHVRGWLGSYEKQIQAVVKNNLQAEPASQAKWSRLKSGQSTGSRSGGTVGPLLTTTWDQGQYYNSLCPADASGPAGHALTGCVATAMAQIIHYWGYPVHGRGSHSYNSNYGTLTVNYDSTNYDYSLMPDALTSTSTTQEVDAVASLVCDCGVAVNMGYSPTESSALDQNARAALINFFRFSPNLSFAEKAYFSESEWDAMLHADLDNNRPVYYSGHGSGGHAFVCDGYDADGYYHFNFGWGGFADGWFLTSSITTGGSNFNDNQAALFGIAPDSTGNVILGQTQGTSTFIVDEPLEFYHLMGHNAYEGGNYDNGCNNTIHFIPADSTNQIVADILDFEDQTLTFSDGDGNPLRSLVGGNDNDYSPVVSSQNALNIAYSGNMYYAGFQLSISQTNPNECRMVSNITSFIESTTVHLTWTENGNATQWEVEYGVKGFALGTGTTYTTTTNTVTFSNLQPLTEYDFYIRSVCGSNYYGQWSKVSLIIQGPYWQDIVTSQPAGYTYNTTTNSVEISTAEQLAWWAKTGNGIDGHLAADIDLSGYRWQPTILSGRNFNGHGHVITNLYVIQGNGFFSQCAEGCIIENVGLTNAYIKSNSEVGGLCNELDGTMRNCYISNSVIDGGVYVGGLVEHNTGQIINCFVNADVICTAYGGLLTSHSYGIIRNCYATGRLSFRTWCIYGGLSAVVQGGEISHCYSIGAELFDVVGELIGTANLTDLSSFVKSDNGWTLSTPVAFDDVTETDLLSALNRGVEMLNDSAYCTWADDAGNGNGSYPVFGNKHIVQCPNVTDVSVQNVTVNNNYAVSIGWTDNSGASQWRIRYRRHDNPDTAYTIVTTTSNPCTIYDIPLGYEYDFSVQAICDANHQSGWSETQTEVVDLPFWTDIVTTGPAGYVEDADGNVEIFSVEGLAWFAVVTNGFHNQEAKSFEGKTVKLKSDVNIEGYRWYPIGTFSGTFDGQNHKISNIYMNDDEGGLFGNVRMGSVKNVILNGGMIICGGGGGLISYAYDCHEISNCHSSASVYSKGRVGDYFYSGYAGSLCGQIENQTPYYNMLDKSNAYKTIVSNCSASGTVFGGYMCGNLIGEIYGHVQVRNCYATGDVNIAAGFSYGSFRGGLIGLFQYDASAYNCFSIGSVEGGSAKVIGSSSTNTHTHYIYGQDNVNEELEMIATDDNDDLSNISQFHHDGNSNTLLNSVSIDTHTFNTLLDALNAWVLLQNDSTLRTWVLDTLTGYPVFGDFFVPSCLNPTNLTVSQATAVGESTIKTRLEWTQEDTLNHWEVLYVNAGQEISSGDFGTIISVNNNTCVLAGLSPRPFDFYVRSVCDENNHSGWCGPTTYIPDKLHWTEVVTSQPDGFQEDTNHNVYISSAEGLSWLSSVMNGLNGAHYDHFNQIELTRDIDLSEYRWTPISFPSGYLSFNGNNHVISGLYCNELSAGGIGLYSRGGYGEVKNLVLTQCNVHGWGGTGVGAILGFGWTSVINCMVNGNVHGKNQVGGLVGHSYGKVENSCFIGTVGGFEIAGGTIGMSDNVHVGGIGGLCPYYAHSNCYTVSKIAGNDYKTYYNVNNSDFSGSGTTWTFNTPPFINGAFRSDLVDALNTWVDVNNTDGQYFRWKTDTSMTNGGYPVFESISYPSTTAQDTVVATGYYSWHGIVFTSDTVLLDTIPNPNGYDSVVTHHIIITPAPLFEITIDTCSNYIWNGITYTKTGDYVQTFPSTVGGDSVAILHLIINPLTGMDVQIACGNSYTWIDGVTYVANNYSATHRLQTTDGCDSVVTLHLTFSNDTGDTTAVACDTFDWYEHTNLTQSGDYSHTFTNASGCDSVVTLHLTFGNNTGDTTAVACDSFDWYEHTNLTQNGDYTHTFTNSFGCDSVVTLHLIFGNNTGDTTAVACDSFDWYEQTNLTQSGDYTHTFTNASGCDSVVTLHLTVNHMVAELVATACDSYTWNGSVYTQSGDYTQTFTAANGCDSVVTLHLTVNNSNSGDTTAVACDSFDWYEYTYLIMSGDYTHVFTNQNGCDSVVTLHLTVNHSVAEFVETTACNSYIWNDSVYTQSGDYTQTFTNDNGCDSIVTLHLTVNYTTTTTVTTGTVNDITPYSAICSDNVIADGCAEVAERGVCWNTSQHPTIADAHTSDGDEAGTFTSLLVGLEPSTTYYMRAYATNSEDTVYGEELMFTTASQFTCGENLVVNYYSYTTMNYGSQCWMTQNLRNASGSEQFDYPDVLQACPTGWHLPDNNDWNTLGIYLPSSSVYFGNGDYWTSTLIPYQTYQGEQFTLISPPYVNSNSVSFSSGTACEVHDAAQGICQVHTELSVRCLRNENAYAALPTVTTQTASNIMPNTATCGGIVTADGGATVTERGVCWSVSENPTIADSHTINGGGAGAFTSQLTGLELNITYHVRAYATNSAGTAYGEDVTFTTDLCGTLSISISGENVISHICESEPVTMTAHVEVDGLTPENLHYTWYEDGQVRDNMTFGLGDTNVYAEYWAARSSIYAFFVEVTYGAHLSCVAQSEEHYVRVYPQPATPVVMVDQTSIYDGGQVVLSVINSDLNTFSYTWYKNGVVIPGATGANIVDNPTTVGGEATQYVYTVEASHLYTGCTSEPSEPTVVMVRVTPTATVTAEGDTVLCEGDSTTLHVNVTPANNSYSYQWYEDGVLIPGATSADYVVSKHARYSAYNFAVRVSESGGFDILVPGPVITVAQPPFVTAFASKTDICEGGTATLTLWVNGSSTTYGYNFQWFRSTPYPDGTSDTNLVGTSSTYTTPSNVPINSYTYWVQATSEYGCIGQSDPITLTINPNPSVTISGNTTFCVGSTTTLYANVTPDQNASYVWYKDGVEAGSHANYITVTNGGVYMVKATVNDCKATDYITITVNDLPATPVVTVDNDIVFEGDQVTLSVTNPIPNATYTWYRSGEIIPNTNQASLIDYPMTIDGESTLHTYTVVAALDISGCVSDVSDYTWVTVFPTPEANVTVNGDTMFCEGGFTTLRVNVTPNNGPSYTYQWYEDGMPIPGATYSSYYVNKPARSTPYNFHVVVSANGSYNVTAFAPAVTIVADPQVEITMADGYPAAFCDGGSTVLQANATGGLGDFSYQWYKNGSTLAGETSQTLALNNLYYGMYDSYTVRVTQYGASCAAISDLQMVKVNLLRYNTLYKTTCEDYTWNGITYAQTGEYTQTFTGANGCDSIVTLHLTVNYANSGDTTAVADDRFDWYEHTYLTMSGDYTHVFTNQNGCDSVITLHLTVNNPTISVQDTVMTAGYFIWHGMVFTSDTVLTEIIPVLDGYDSLMVYHIFVTPTPLTVLTVDACVSYTLNGQTYAESGDYVQTFPLSSGMDSVVVLYLTIFPADSAEFAETACESFTWEGTTYTTSGDYTKTFTNVNGCDSVVTLHLTIFPADSAEFAETACEFFAWEGTTYTTSGDYTQTFTNASGCDSVVILHLTVNYGTHNIETETACESFTWHDTTYTTSGTYTYEYTNASGCASVDTLQLTVNHGTHNVETETACESFTWHGMTYTTSGTYTYEYTNAAGCASVDTLILSVNFGTHNVETETACESFTWHGVTYTTSGTYTYEYTNADGCASVDTLYLTVNYGTHNVETETACESFMWHGTEYTASGTYTHEYNNNDGCVSVDTLKLTVNHSVAELIEATACESYTWNDSVYTQSGDYTRTFTTSTGCDSVVTLHLTVNHGTYNVETESACENYEWHGVTYTTSGTYTYEYNNADGCASVDTLHLTINFAQSAEFAVETSDSCYTWNAETYCESGDYTQTLTAANGCDSTVTLHLTITVGIDDHNDFDFKVYPNPTTDVVDVQITNHNSPVTEFHVYDAYGKLIRVVDVHTAQIDLSGFAAGVYFVKAVADGNVVAVRKVVKQ